MTTIYKARAYTRVETPYQKSNQSAPAGFFMSSDLQLQACYNGIGPDRWSSRFRKLTTNLLRFFESDALIHDWEYTYQPKTYMHFTLANLRFSANAFINAYDAGDGKWSTIWQQTYKGVLGACQHLAGYCHLH